MNRKQFRQVSKKLTREEYEKRIQAVEDEVASAFLLVAINVLGSKYEWEQSALEQVTIDLVDEYNRISSVETYKNETYDKWGISIERCIDG